MQQCKDDEVVLTRDLVPMIKIDCHGRDALSECLRRHDDSVLPMAISAMAIRQERRCLTLGRTEEGLNRRVGSFDSVAALWDGLPLLVWRTSCVQGATDYTEAHPGFHPVLIFINGLGHSS